MSQAVRRAVVRFGLRRHGVTIASEDPALRRALARSLRTLDKGLTLADLYDDLVERAWHALQEVKARAVSTRDEDLGHEFHGNQWTGGLGAKPKTHSQKTSKAAVHELLSSGHPFTKAELMDIAGIKTEKLFSDYMAMLKNPKYAGPKGALAIQAKGGHYYVALPNGHPAPPLEKATANQELPDLLDDLSGEVVPGAADPHKSIKQMLAEKKAAVAPDPSDQFEIGEDDFVPDDVAAKVAAASHTPLALPDLMADLEKLEESDKADLAASKKPLGPGVGQMLGAHPGSMSTSAADKHYATAMSVAHENLKDAIANGANDAASHHVALLKFKEAKASAMAAWATAVHGAAYSPKPQAVYKADTQLAKDLKAGTALSVALSEWKTNTAAEKAGNFPAKAPTPASKAAAAAEPPKPVADMGHAAPVQPILYDTLVPASHEQIGAADFATASGAWNKGLSKLRHDLQAEGAASASDNKKGVESRLRERLKDKPNFQALVKRLGLAKEGYGSIESRLIGAWAGSSGDTHDISVALQMAVRDAFSIPDGHIEKAALNSLNVHGHDVDKLTAKAIQSLNENTDPLKPHEVQTARAALQEFVQAQYHETQDMLQKMGHEHVYLARGMKVKVNHDNAHGAANVRLQPASSFSAQYSTADIFAGYSGTVFLVKVPRQQVLSTYLTGFGCTGEHEVVVLAHSSLKAHTVKKGLTQAAAASAIHSQVGGLAKTVASALAKSKAPTAPKQHAQTLHPDAGSYEAQKAALKKAVINAKSKAYKAAKTAEKLQLAHKAAHAAKAAEEAKQAVQALQAFMSGLGGKK